MRISKKQILNAFFNYKLKHKTKEIWQGLNNWSIFEFNEKGNWINEVEFKSNKGIFNYLKEKG